MIAAAGAVTVWEEEVVEEVGGGVVVTDEEAELRACAAEDEIESCFTFKGTSGFKDLEEPCDANILYPRDAETEAGVLTLPGRLYEISLDFVNESLTLPPKMPLMSLVLGLAVSSLSKEPAP